MSLIVCKFGGTSVASPERIQMVAKKLIAKKQAGHDDLNDNRGFHEHGDRGDAAAVVTAALAVLA